MWQPYEADLGCLLAFCVARRDTWMARVPLVCFCIVKRHHPDRVLRQFGLAQQPPNNVVYDDRLHGIDLGGKVGKNWKDEHGPYTYGCCACAWGCSSCWFNLLPIVCLPICCRTTTKASHII